MTGQSCLPVLTVKDANIDKVLLARDISKAAFRFPAISSADVERRQPLTNASTNAERDLTREIPASLDVGR